VEELMALLQTYPALLKVLVAFSVMGVLFVIYLFVLIFWKILSHPGAEQKAIDNSQDKQLKELASELRKVSELDKELKELKSKMQ